MRRPGIEPGSTAWKATMLAFTTPTQMINNITQIHIFHNCHKMKMMTAEALSRHMNIDVRKPVFGLSGLTQTGLYSHRSRLEA